MARSASNRSRNKHLLTLLIAVSSLVWLLLQLRLRASHPLLIAGLAEIRDLHLSEFLAVPDYHHQQQQNTENEEMSGQERADTSGTQQQQVLSTLPSSEAIASTQEKVFAQMTIQQEKIPSPLSSSTLTKQSTRRRPRIAYVISVTECALTVVDGAAVLAESIRQTQSDALQDYQLIALLYEPAASDCAAGLKYLGYQVLLKDLPFVMKDFPPQWRTVLQKATGCCGMAEYLKLYAYTLTDYDAVIHLDVDVIVLKPLEPLIHVVLKGRLFPANYSSQEERLYTIPANYTIPDSVDFLYTRDYNTFNPNEPRNRLKNGVQGAFFVVVPSLDRYNELLHTLKTTPYDGLRRGWNRSGFGGYYGAAQIQGLFSYFYYHHKETIVELDHCRYNSLGTDLRFLKFKKHNITNICRTTGEASPANCPDCSTTPAEDIYLGHLSSCFKPWWCDHAVYNIKTPVCRQLTQRWFVLRDAVNRHMNLPVPTFDPNRTLQDKAFDTISLGYCRGLGKDKYVPVELPAEFAVQVKEREFNVYLNK